MSLPLKIYLAGPWETHPALRLRAAELKEAGFEITHEWYSKNIGLTSECDGLLDTIGVERCDVFVAVMPLPDYAYMGTFTELGMALALKKHIYVVMPADSESVKFKPRRNVFLRSGAVCMLETWEDFLKAIGARDKSGQVPKKRPYEAIEAVLMRVPEGK